MDNARPRLWRYLAPNAITFASLGCGIASILLASTGSLYWAGLLILTSYILDLFDGTLARKLGTSTTFGLQLDSLVDMVSLGTAPAFLAFTHLYADSPDLLPYMWPVAILFPLSGAFRLARFNLLPMKSGMTDSAGLTISTAGATLALAVLADLEFAGETVPDYALPILMVVLAGLMVSLIPFPAISWPFSRKRVGFIIVASFVVSVFLLPSWASAWFVFTLLYLLASLIRWPIVRRADRGAE